jgi:hypothetical protein
MKRRVRSHPKARAKSSRSPTSISPFGPPQLLEGEDAAAYDELHARIYAAVKPVDVIDEMFIADAVSLEWEVLRWRRLKFTMIRKRVIKALKDVLTDKLPPHLFEDYFAEDLTDVLQEHLPKDEAEKAQPLAHAFIRDEPSAMDKVNEVFDEVGRDWSEIGAGARDRKLEELVQAYTRREPDTVTLINRLLADPLDTLMADALANQLDYVERIDRLAAIAESRRNASLREIERRRAVLDQALRRSVQQIEDAEFEVIETMPAKGKNAV